MAIWVPQLGDVLVTRNYDEDDNTSPGFWNHCATIIGDGNIIHAIKEVDSIIREPLKKLVDECGAVAALRLRNQSRINKFISELKDLEGVHYRTIASMFQILRKTSRGENCVSAVRKAYRDSYGVDPKWFIPDNVFSDERFEIVGRKNVTIMSNRQIVKHEQANQDPRSI